MTMRTAARWSAASDRLEIQPFLVFVTPLLPHAAAFLQEKRLVECSHKSLLNYMLCNKNAIKVSVALSVREQVANLDCIVGTFPTRSPMVAPSQTPCLTRVSKHFVGYAAQRLTLLWSPSKHPHCTVPATQVGRSREEPVNHPGQVSRFVTGSSPTRGASRSAANCCAHKLI